MMDQTGTNTDFIKAGLIYPYVNSVTVYKCPADKNIYPKSGGTPVAVTRSMSMNCWMNPIRSWNDTGGHYSGAQRVTEYKKQGDLSLLGTSMTWLLIDENPYAIDDGYFV